MTLASPRQAPMRCAQSSKLAYVRAAPAPRRNPDAEGSMPTSIADCFAEPLLDLGADASPLAGIFVPQSQHGVAKVGVTDQFLARAGDYHARYTNVAYFRALLDTAFAEVGGATRDLVLDIGSGSGNSVFGCLELLPEAHVVAVDISPDLLQILRDAVEADPALRGRVTPVCMSATHDPYAPGRFGLAVGAAILHHLPDPRAAIGALAHALEPGARAIFFEPFENGSAVLRIAYTDLLERAERERRDFDAPGMRLLEDMLRDYGFRAGIDPSAPGFLDIDDKWLFTRSMFEDYAQAAGFSGLEITPLHALEAPFSHQTETNLRLGRGLEPDALPDWCWDRLGWYDEIFSLALKRDLLLEGRVVLTR